MIRIVIPLLCLLLAQASLTAQRKCYKCKGEGVIACTKKKDHDPKRLCGKVTIEHKCTSLFGAKCCRGTQKLACTRCGDPVAEAELNEILESRESWVNRQREFMKETKIRATTVETKHFTLHWAPRRWIGKARRYNREHAAHFFAERLEKLAKRWKEVTGVVPRNRQTITIAQSAAENMTYTLHKMGGGYSNAFRRSGLTGMVCSWPDPAAPRELSRDEYMHVHVVHMATHLLHRASLQFYLEHIAWFDIGLVHWFDIDQVEITRDFCFRETQAKSSWQNAEWKKKLFDEFRSNKETNFADLIKKGVDGMNHRDHAHCFGALDFLINTQPKKFKDFYAAMKRENDTKKALDKVFNMSTASFHDQWRKWVLKQYAGN